VPQVSLLRPGILLVEAHQVPCYNLRFKQPYLRETETIAYDRWSGVFQVVKTAQSRERTERTLLTALSQLLWPDRGSEVWFSLGENHEKACRFGLHQLRNCLRGDSRSSSSKRSAQLQASGIIPCVASTRPGDVRRIGRSRGGSAGRFAVRIETDAQARTCGFGKPLQRAR
jgi:hypothetical protein